MYTQPTLHQGVTCASNLRDSPVVLLPQLVDGELRSYAKTTRQYLSYECALPRTSLSAVLAVNIAREYAVFLSYVFRYLFEKCSSELENGECFGSVELRHTIATATMSSLSQFRTNTERQRMADEGQSRNVDVLWLLSLSAPASQWKDELANRLRAIALSFEIP